jgi:hypothetical protein
MGSVNLPRTVPMELILSAYGATTLILLSVQVFEYIAGSVRLTAIERHPAVPFERLPRAPGKPITEPTAHFERAA